MVARRRQKNANSAATIRNGSHAQANGNQPPGAENQVPNSILVIDIGGSKIKLLVSGETRPRKAMTGKNFTPNRLVDTVNRLAHDWKFDAITIGVPCLVGMNGPISEPGNLGTG